MDAKLATLPFPFIWDTVFALNLNNLRWKGFSWIIPCDLYAMWLDLPYPLSVEETDSIAHIDDTKTSNFGWGRKQVWPGWLKFRLELMNGKWQDGSNQCLFSICLSVSMLSRAQVRRPATCQACLVKHSILIQSSNTAISPTIVTQTEVNQVRDWGPFKSPYFKTIIEKWITIYKVSGY